MASDSNAIDNWLQGGRRRIAAVIKALRRWFGLGG